MPRGKTTKRFGVLQNFWHQPQFQCLATGTKKVISKIKLSNRITFVSLFTVYTWIISSPCVEKRLCWNGSPSLSTQNPDTAIKIVHGEFQLLIQLIIVPFGADWLLNRKTNLFSVITLKHSSFGRWSFDRLVGEWCVLIQLYTSS